MEFQLQSKYSNLFPRVYAHSPDFKVMVVQKAKILTSFLSPDFEQVLETNFPNFMSKFSTNPFNDWNTIVSALMPGNQKKMIPVEKIEALKQDKKFMEMHRYVNNNRVDVKDIDFGNIGYDPKNYNLLLIDSALHLHQGDVT